MRIHWIIIATVLLWGTVVSNADIVHNPTNFLLGEVWQGAEYFNLDVNSDGVVDFSLQASLNYFAGIHPEGQNKYLIHPSPPPPNIGGPVAALSFNYLIDSTPESSAEEWYGSDNYSTIIYKLSTGTAGEFIRTRGYIGLEFESAEGTHYGWLDIEGVPNGGSYFFVHGWAYESTPGVGIAAGAIPEPSSVLLIAVGATGIWMGRKKKFR